VTDGGWPLSQAKDHTAESVFRPENLLREARRQRRLPDVPVPRVCLLDPDGDIVRYLVGSGTGRRHSGWACYHTEMWVAGIAGDDVTDVEVGVVGNAVGAPFAVLVAEQLHASGAALVVSITSAGQLVPLAEPPSFVLIEAALRDEGTSTHYRAPARWAHAPRHLLAPAASAGRLLPEPVLAGASWTTDAPYRETATAIDAAVAAGAVCVEMESAALYAYAAAGPRRPLPRARHEHDGDRGRRLRKGSRERRPGGARLDRSAGQGPARTVLIARLLPSRPVLRVVLDDASA
jgi:hypothetical protein